MQSLESVELFLLKSGFLLISFRVLCYFQHLKNMKVVMNLVLIVQFT